MKLTSMIIGGFALVATSMAPLLAAEPATSGGNSAPVEHKSIEAILGIPKELAGKIAGSVVTTSQPVEPLEVQKERKALFDTYIKAANTLIEQGKYDDAVAKYQEAIDQVQGGQSMHTFLRTWKGDAYQKQGKLDKAEAAYKEAGRLAQDSKGMPYRRLGDLYVRQGRYTEAIDAYRMHMPDSLTNFKIALLQAQLGQNEAAIHSYHLGLGVELTFVQNPDYPIAVTMPNRPFLDVRFFPNAFDKRLFEAAAHVALGKVFQEEGQNEDALAQYDEALRIKSDFAVGYYYRGMWLRGRGPTRWAEAQTMYEKAASLGRAELRAKAQEASGKLASLSQLFSVSR